jgi:hypothetical protein
MKLKLLLDKLAGILNDEHRAQIEKYKSLKKILKALRKEKVNLELNLEETQDEEQRHEFESRLKIVSAQRKKGLKVLKELKQKRKQSQ